MSRLFTIIYCISVCVGQVVNAQYDFDAVEKNRMAKAKVKTQTQYTHDFVDGKPSEKGYKSAVTKYNTNGDVTEIVNYNGEGKVISLVVYQYDSKGNRINHERYQGNREKLQYSQKIVYDANNNKNRESGFDGASMYSNTYKYDEAGKLIEITYMVDNALVEKRKLTHSGNKMTIQIFDPNNKLIFKQENIYDANRQLVSEVKTGGTENVIHTVDLLYNNTGGLLEETKKRTGEILEYKKLYFYDNANHLLREEIVNLDGTKYISHEYQYNSLGDLALESWKKNSKAKENSTKEIKYDSKGLYTETDCYFASYKLRSLYKYTYEF